MGGQSYKRLFTDHLCPEICIVCISVKPLSEKLFNKNCMKLYQNLIIIIIVNIIIIIIIIIEMILFKYILKVFVVLFVKTYTPFF